MQVVAAVGRVLVKAPRGQLVVAAADLAQVAQRRERDGAHLHVALFAQRHDGDGFALARLGKRVLERRPGVADRLAAQKVNEHRDVIKQKLNELGAPSVTKLNPSKYDEMYNFLESL